MSDPMTADMLLGRAQVRITIVFLTGYFGVLALFMLGFVRTPPEWKDVLTTLISLLTAGVLLILQFWFSRSRQGGGGLVSQQPEGAQE